MGLMNERGTDQMGCVHPWPVLVDLRVRKCVCVCVQDRTKGWREPKRAPLFERQEQLSVLLTSRHNS